MMLSLTGCGKETKKANNVQKSSQGQKTKTIVGKEWKDIDKDNFVVIIKEKTGINLNNLEGFT